MWVKIILIITVLLFSWCSIAFAGSSQPQPDPSSLALVQLANETITHRNYSAYQLGGSHFDLSRGIFVLDCSNYVNHLLQQANPNAYAYLIAKTRSYKPTSEQYYNFFNQLPDVDNTQYGWQKINDARELKAGDILVFRYHTHNGRTTGGHVMLVMDQVLQNNNILKVRVADSAAAAHSQDTRPSHHSGIGEGTLLLKMSTKTGQLYAYAWKENSAWQSAVSFAIARPVQQLA